MTRQRDGWEDYMPGGSRNTIGGLITQDSDIRYPRPSTGDDCCTKYICEPACGFCCTALTCNFATCNNYIQNTKYKYRTLASCATFVICAIPPIYNTIAAAIDSGMTINLGTLLTTAPFQAPIVYCTGVSGCCCPVMTYYLCKDCCSERPATEAVRGASGDVNGDQSSEEEVITRQPGQSYNSTDRDTGSTSDYGRQAASATTIILDQEGNVHEHQDNSRNQETSVFRRVKTFFTRAEASTSSERSPVIEV